MAKLYVWNPITGQLWAHKPLRNKDGTEEPDPKLRAGPHMKLISADDAELVKAHEQKRAELIRAEKPAPAPQLALAGREPTSAEAEARIQAAEREIARLKVAAAMGPQESQSTPPGVALPGGGPWTELPDPDEMTKAEIELELNAGGISDGLSHATKPELVAKLKALRAS